MTESDEPFSAVDRDFKPSVDKLIPMHDLLSWKPKYVGYDVVRSYGWIVLSETKSWYSQEDVDDFFCNNQLVVLNCCVYLIVNLQQPKQKYWYC